MNLNDNLHSIPHSNRIKSESNSILINLPKAAAIYCLLFAISFAQQPTQEWVSRYSRGNFADGISVRLDSMGCVYVLLKMGDTVNTFLNDIGAVKYSPSGNLQWSVRYNQPSNASVQGWYFDVTPSGYVYMAAEMSFISQPYDAITVMKYESNGTFDWSNTYYGGNSGCSVTDIKVDKTGEIVVGGINYINNIAYPLMMRYNPAGDTLWTKTVQSLMHGNIDKIVIDDSGSIYATGYITIGPVFNYLTLKYNSAGNLDWYSTYDGPDHLGSSANCIAVDSAKNVYVAGTNSVPSPGLDNNTLLKMNSNGVILWDGVYTGIAGNKLCGAPADIAVSSDGNSIYYSTYCQWAGGNSDYITLGYNSIGDSIWVRRFRGDAPNGFSTPTSLKLDRLNNVYVTGIGNYGTTGNDYATVKYLSNGMQQWAITYNGPLANSDDGTYSLFVDKDLNVYVTGTSSRQNSPFLWDASTIKYSQPIGIENISSNLPGSFKLGQNYPNPFNSSTVIEYELPKSTFVELKIYNLLGQVVNTLVSGTQQASYYTVMLNADDLASGIYFYVLRTDEFTDSKKMILVK